MTTSTTGDNFNPGSVPNSSEAEQEIELQAASGDLKRSIFMTEKGSEQFQVSCNSHLKKIKKVWCAV